MEKSLLGQYSIQNANIMPQEESTIEHVESSLHREESTIQHSKSSLHREESTIQQVSSWLHPEESTIQHVKFSLHPEGSKIQHVKSSLIPTDSPRNPAKVCHFDQTCYDCCLPSPSVCFWLARLSTDLLEATGRGQEQI